MNTQVYHGVDLIRVINGSGVAGMYVVMFNFYSQLEYIMYAWLLTCFGVCVLMLYYALVQLKRYVLYRPHKLTQLQSYPLREDVFHSYVRTLIGNDMLAIAQHKPLATQHCSVFTHGNYGNMFDYFHFFDVIPSLVLWDYRGYGKSSGAPHERLNSWDLGAIVQALPDSITEFTLIGHSLGTNVTLSYLEHALRHNLPLPKQVVLIHPFLNFADVVYHNLGSRLMKFFGWLVGDMDQSTTLVNYLAANPLYSVHILYTLNDKIAPATPVLELLRNTKRVFLHDVGGEHHHIYHNENIFNCLKQIT